MTDAAVRQCQIVRNVLQRLRDGPGPLSIAPQKLDELATAIVVALRVKDELR